MEEQGGTHMEKEPIKRSPLRLRLGTAYYGTLRKLRWSANCNNKLDTPW